MIFGETKSSNECLRNRKKKFGKMENIAEELLKISDVWKKFFKGLKEFHKHLKILEAPKNIFIACEVFQTQGKILRG